MVAAVREQWAPNVTADNEAGAVALLHYTFSELVPAAR